MYLKNINSNLTLTLIVSLVSVGQLASTIYLPALPVLTVHFHVTSTYIQYTCSAYILAFACSQFVYGPLSDHYGRRIVILSSLLIFITGCVLSFIATTASVFLLGSFVQGMGMGCSSSMARTILRDLSNDENMQKMAGYISMSLMIMPLIGPLVGGYIQELFSWHANVLFLLVLGIVGFVLILKYMPETNRTIKMQSLTLNNILTTYVALAGNKRFLAYTLCGLFSISAEVCYEISTPFLLQSGFNLTPSQYGWINILPLLGYLVGVSLATQIQKMYSTYTTTLLGLSILILGGCALLSQHYLLIPTIAGIVIPMLISMIGLGTIFPCSIAGGMLPFSTAAGAAGAAMSGLQNLGASVASVLIAFFPTNTAIPLSFFLLVGGLLSSIFFIALISYDRQEGSHHV
jgi:DHA1 family 2-module integral membrane pump EmrD-like MFS transporter